MQAISECFKNFPRSFEVLLVVPVWERWCRIWDGVSYFSPSPPQLCSGPVTTPTLQPCVVSMSTVQTRRMGEWLTASSLEAVHDFSGCNWYLRPKEALESKSLLWMCRLLHLWSFLPALLATSQLSEDNSSKPIPSTQVLVYSGKHLALLYSVYFHSPLTTTQWCRNCAGKLSLSDFPRIMELVNSKWGIWTHVHVTADSVTPYPASLLGCAGCLFRPRVNKGTF